MTSGEWTTQLGKVQKEFLALVAQFPGEPSSFFTKRGFRQSVLKSLRDRGFIVDEGSEDRRAWVLTEKGEESLDNCSEHGESNPTPYKCWVCSIVHRVVFQG